MRKHVRIVNPKEVTSGYASRRMNVMSQRELLSEMAAGDRSSVARSVPMPVFETLTFYAFDITATDRADTLYLATATTVSSVSNQQRYMGAPGKIVSIRLALNTPCTAGSLTAGMRVIEGADTTDYQFDDCVIASTAAAPLNQSNHVRFPWEAGVPFDAGMTICGRYVASGFTPTTADLTMQVVVGYEDAKL